LKLPGRLLQPSGSSLRRVNKEFSAHFRTNSQITSSRVPNVPSGDYAEIIGGELRDLTCGLAEGLQ
jgi:hypothetical protein